MPLAWITYERLCGFKAKCQEKGLSIPTIKARLDCLRGALDLAVARDLIPKLPHWPRLVDTRPKRAKRAPSRAEYEAVRPFIPPHHLDWYDGAYWAGMRKGDLAKYRRFHLDMVQGLWVRLSTKTKARPELFPLPPRWRDLLEVTLELRPRGENERMFGAWTNASRDIGRACARAGIPRFTANDLRRGCRARLIVEGHEPAVIRLWMCHSDEVARTYYEAMNDDLRLQTATRMSAK
jgi:integrase